MFVRHWLAVYLSIPSCIQHLSSDDCLEVKRKACRTSVLYCRGSRTIGSERHRATCNWCTAPWSHHANAATTALIARVTTSPIQSRCPISVYPAMHRRIWQTTVSSSLTSAHANSARPTQRCVLFDIHTTPSVIGVSQRLDHACGTRCPLNYDNVTLFNSSDGCCRHTCLGTTALCGI